MKNILARGGVEFLAVFLGIALSLWVDEYQKTKESKKLSNQILNRLYKNLEADSTDGLWNQKAHNLVIDSGDFILDWCKTNDDLNDSIEIHLSRLAIATTLVNIEEEYNALKSSGRMELLEDEKLVTALHDYYSWVNYIKIMQINIRSIVVDQYLPFMSNYSEYFGLIKDKNIYEEMKKFVYERNKFEFHKEILEKINNGTFLEKNFDELGTGIIENVTLNSVKDNNIFNINSVKILYSLPIGSFTLINDDENNIYLSKNKSMTEESINYNSDEYLSFIRTQLTNDRKSLLKSYDTFLNDKYTVDINQQTLERVKNYFK